METIIKSTGKYEEDELGNRVGINEVIQVSRILNPRENRWFAYGPDGRFYRVHRVSPASPRSIGQFRPYWAVLYEVRQYSIVKNVDGTRNFPQTIRNFISSQFGDGEEMTPESVAQLLAHAEHKNKDGTYVSFEGCYSTQIRGGHWSDKNFFDVLEGMGEEILVDLFCETENADRVLSEENGVFKWETRLGG